MAAMRWFRVSDCLHVSVSKYPSRSEMLSSSNPKYEWPVTLNEVYLDSCVAYMCALGKLQSDNQRIYKFYKTKAFKTRLTLYSTPAGCHWPWPNDVQCHPGLCGCPPPSLLRSRSTKRHDWISPSAVFADAWKYQNCELYLKTKIECVLNVFYVLYFNFFNIAVHWEFVSQSKLSLRHFSAKLWSYAFLILMVLLIKHIAESDFCMFWRATGWYCDTEAYFPPKSRSLCRTVVSLVGRQ